MKHGQFCFGCNGYVCTFNRGIWGFGICVMLFLLPNEQIRADHFWGAQDLTVITTSPGVFDIEFTFQRTSATTDNFYWELYASELGCGTIDGFSLLNTGCTITTGGSTSNGGFGNGNQNRATLITDVMLCPGKSYDFILFTRRMNGSSACGTPEDRDGSAQANGDLIQWPNVGGGAPSNIWDGVPVNFDDRTITNCGPGGCTQEDPNEAFDGNWAYLILTPFIVDGDIVWDYQAEISFEDECFVAADVVYNEDYLSGAPSMDMVDYGIAQIRCGTGLSVNYNSNNLCPSMFDGNTYEIIDNSTIAGLNLSSANMSFEMGVDTNVNGRYNILSDAAIVDEVCESGLIDLTFQNATCAFETNVVIQLTYEVEVLYPTSEFATPIRVNCSDACGQDIVLSGGPQWQANGLNMGTATTLPATDLPNMTFAWSGQVCSPIDAGAIDCMTGDGQVNVDQCASCGIYDISYEIADPNCGTCSSTTTKQVQIVSPVVNNVQSATATGCGDFIPDLSFDVVECNPVDGSASTIPYTGDGSKFWERSDMPGVFIPEGSVDLTVVAGTSITFTPHFRNSGCASCNATGSPITIEAFQETPAPTIATPSIEICEGGAVTLSASCAACASGSAVTITWFNQAINGNAQGTGASFTPTSGTSVAAEGPYSNSIPGTYTFYAECSCDGCPSPRAPVRVIVVGNPTIPASVVIPIECSISASGTVSLSQLFPNVDFAPSNFTVGTGTTIIGGALIYDEPGCYSVNYNFDNGVCPAVGPVTSYVFVSQQPQPSFNIQNELCISAGDAAAILTPDINCPSYSALATRMWTIVDGITNATATIVASSGVVTVTPTGGEVSGSLTSTLVETITNASCNGNGPTDCMESYSQTVIVEDGTALDASFTASSMSICTGLNVDLIPITNGGVFTGLGVTDSGSGTGGTFTNASPGIYQVDYTISTGAGCTNISSLNIEVIDVVDASISSITICSEENSFFDLNNLISNGTNIGGTFALVSTTNAGVVSGSSLQYAGEGDYVISYTVGDPSNCGGTACTNASGDDCYATQTATITVGAPCGSLENNSTECVIYEDQFNGSGVYLAGNCTGALPSTCATFNIGSPPSTITLATSPAVVGANTNFIEMDGADDFVSVNNGQMSFNSINSLACFETPVQDISGATTGANWNIDLSQTSGTLEPDDFIAVYEIVDGGTPTLITQINNDFAGTQTVSNTGVIGSTLQLQICMQNGDVSGADRGPVEEYSIDNIVFSGAPDATINDQQLDCAVSPTGTFDLTALFDGTTSSGGDFSFTMDGTSSSGSTTIGAIISENTLLYNAPGCYHIFYEVQCNDAIASNDAFVLIREEPQPNFNIQNQICWSVGDLPASHIYTPQINSPIYDSGLPDRTFMVTGPATLLNTNTGEIQITGEGLVFLTMTEEISYDACGSFPVGTCDESFSIEINVEDGTSQDASFTTSDNPICASDVITLTPLTEGGLFTGDGVTDNGLGTGGTFSNLQPGIYQVDYTLNTSNGCTNVYSQNIEVLPNISGPFFTTDQSICICPGSTFDIGSFLLSSAPTGGSFSLTNGTVASLVSGSSAILFDEDCGDITIEYSVEDCDGSMITDEIVITIRECPTAFMDFPDFFCQDDGNFNISTQVSEFTGCDDYNINFNVISGPSPADDLIGGAPVDRTVGSFTSVTINPRVSAGTYRLRVTMSDPSGICENVVIESAVTIYADPDEPLGISSVADVCETGTFPIVLTLQDETDEAGDIMEDGEVRWFGDGTSDGTGTTGSFTPPDTDGDGLPGPGIFTVCANFGSPLCEETACTEITILDNPTIATPIDIQLECVTNYPDNVSLSSLFSQVSEGGTYSIGGNSDSGGEIQDGAFIYNNSGCFEVCYTIPAGTCNAAQLQECATIYISERPEGDFELTDEVCWNGIPGSLSVLPSITANAGISRTWSLGTNSTTTTSTVNPTTGQITINDDGVLELCLTETITSSSCSTFGTSTCDTTVCKFITIRNSTDLNTDWTLIKSNFCVATNVEFSFTLGPNAATGGIFSGTGVSGTHPTYTFNPATAGVGSHTICYTVSDASGCSAVTCQNIQVIDAAQATMSDLVICGSDQNFFDLSVLLDPGSQDGGIYTVNSGGTGAGDIVNNILTYSTSGTFNIQYQVGDQATCDGPCTPASDTDCYALATAILTISDEIVITVTKTDELCEDDNNGTIMVSQSGGAAPYTYAWADAPSTSDTRTGLSAGTYTVTVTDNNGCTGTQTVEIQEPQALNIVMLAQMDVLCNGESTGTTLVAGTGGIAPYSFSSSSSGITVDGNKLVGFNAGDHDVIVTDSNACTDTITMTFTEPALLTISTVGTDPLCSGIEDGRVSTTVAGGTPIYHYLWSNGSTDKDLRNVDAGTYTVTVTDNNGCTAIATETLVPAVAITVTNITTTNADCENSTDGTATINISGGTSPYDYSISTGQSVLDTASTSKTFSGLDAGFYTFLVVDAFGCMLSGSFNIDADETLELEILESTNETCNVNNDGMATARAGGGQSPYTFIWSGGTIDPSVTGTDSRVTGLEAGLYTVTVVDSRGCDRIRTVEIDQPQDLRAILINSTDVFCNGENSGEIIVNASGGIAPITFTSDAGNVNGNVISDLGAGIVEIIAEDSNGCSDTLMVTITEPELLDIAITLSTNPTCFDSNDGVIDVTTTGGAGSYNYLWNTGSTDKTLRNISASTSGSLFMVTVVDNNGCIDSAEVTLTAPEEIILAIPIVTNASCDSEEDGQVQLGITSGGLSPLTYNLSTGESNMTGAFTTLASGGYTYSVTDANGCEASGAFEIDDPNELELTINDIVHITCNGGTDGSARVTASGGTGPYDFDWSDGTANDALNVASGENTASNLSAGIYTVLVTDDMGCQEIQTIKIKEPDTLGAVAIITEDETCPDLNNGEIVLVATGGTAPYSFSATSLTFVANTASGVAAGTYTITVTDNNNCSAVVSVTVNEPAVLSVTLSPNDPTCNAGNDGSIDASPSGGTIPYRYVWSNGAANQDPSNLSSGSYTVTITDANGCTAINNVTLNDPEPIILAAPVITDANCDGGQDGSVILGVTGGATGIILYELSTGDFNMAGSFTTLAAGGYTYKITDSNGCTAEGAFEVNDPNELELTVLDEVDVECFGEINGSGTVEALDGTAPYTFTWSGGIIPADPNANPNTVPNLSAGTYTVTVTDAQGCQEIETLEIEEPDTLELIIISTDNETCPNDNNGMITVDASGGSPSYTYSSSPLLTFTGNIANNVAAGTYTITVTDMNGCTNSQMLTITEDSATPTIVAPNDLSIACTGGEAAALVISAWLDSAIISGVGNLTITNDYTTNIDFCSGSATLVTWTVTDECGNSESDMATITITPDITPPVITVPSNLTLDCSDISETADPSALITQFLNGATVTDECDNDIELSFTGAEGLDICVASTSTITWTAVDDCSNMSTNSATITIIPDIDPPVINAPATFAIDCSSLGSGDASFIIDSLIAAASVSDNCDGGVILNNSYNTSQLDLCADATYDIVITYSAQDICGNVATEQTTTVTITPDTDPPVITAPDAFTIDCSSLGNGDASFIIDSLIAAASVSDNCDGGVILNNSYNTSQLDLCADATYDIVITYSAQDICGNVATEQTTTITITPDTDPPVINAPATFAIDCSSLGNGDASFIIDSLIAAASVSDNCDGGVILNNSYNTSQLDLCADATYDIVITYSAQDICGNVATEQTTTVTITPDTDPPVINAPATFAIDCSSLGNGDASFIIDSLIAAASVSDNCDGGVILNNSYNTSQLDLCADATYDIVITYSAQDICANVATEQTTTITITPDTDPPVINAPDAFAIDCSSLGNGDASFIIDSLIAAASVSDNCDGGVILNNSYNTSQLDLCADATYDIVITYSAQDICANVATEQTTTITITPDTDPPVITAPATFAIDCSSLGNGDASFIIDSLIAAASVSDNCDGGVILNNSYNTSQLDLCADATYDIVITYSAQDICANVATEQTTTITITPDTDPPVINAPATFAIDCSSLGNGDASFIIDSLIAAASVSDNCDGGVILNNSYNTSQLDLCADATYDIVITYSAQDICGNVATEQTTTITIIPDITPPTVVCCANFDISLNSTGATILDLSDIDCGSTDNCTSQGQLTRRMIRTFNGVIDEGINGQSFELTAEDLGTSTISLIVEDFCGNADTCDVLVTLTSDQAIGIAKRVVKITPNSDGSNNVMYEFNIRNYGNVDIDSLQVEDLLAPVFNPCAVVSVVAITSDDYTVNEDYNGITDIELLTGNDNLEVDDKGSILLEILVDNCGGIDGPFNNTAEVSGVSPDGNRISDVSQNGSDPDPNNNGPGDNSEITPVQFVFFSFIGVAKSVNSLEIFEDGSADVTYRFTIENFGNITLDSITLKDNLLGVFDPCAVVEVVPTSVTSSFFEVNNGYDGFGDIELLNMTLDNRLEPGEIGTVFVTIHIDDCTNDPPVFLNQAFVVAKDEGGSEIVEDFSQNGNDPDPDGNGDPTTPDNDIRTPVDIGFNPAIGIAKRVVSSPSLRDDGCFDITYEFKVKNYGDLAIGGIQVSDNFLTTFDLADTFYVVGATSEEFDINPDYDGGYTDASILTGLDTLNIEFAEGEEGSILIDVVVCTDDVSRTYNNSAIVTGTALNNEPLTDLSTDGSDPDPDGRGADSSSIPTPVTMNINPGLTLTKRISETPTDNGDGTFDFSYEIRVENVGDVPIIIDEIIDSLDITFADAASWEIIRRESEHFELDENYNGQGNYNLIAKSEVLEVDDAGSIFLGVRVATGDDIISFLNSASVSGSTILGGDFLGGDLSDDSSIPITLSCQNRIVCPAWPDTIFQENDAGWCHATVNFPLAEVDTCAGTGDIQFEYMLIGQGANGITTDVWNLGQPSGLEYQVGMTQALIRFTYTTMGVTEISDTCTFLIDVIDKEAPILMAGIPEDMTLDCCTVWDTFHLQQHHVRDNCLDSLYIFEEVITSRSNDPFDCGYYNYSDTIIWTVTDSSRVLEDGTLLNVSTWKQVVNHIDTFTPAIILPPDITVTECLPDTTYNITGYEVIHTDTTTESIQLEDGTWAVFEVISKDTVLTIDTIFNDIAYGQALAIGKCAPDSVMAALLTYRDSVEIVCKGDKEAIIHRIWEVIDPCGKSAQAIQQITILDKNPPEINCKSEVTLSLDEFGRRRLVQSDLLNSVTTACYDNTENAEILIEPSIFDCGDLGRHRVLITATDICGGQSSYCEVFVTIIDTIAPVINCPTTPIVIDAIPDNCAIDIPELNNILGNQDCNVEIMTRPQLFAEGLAMGMHTVEVIARDQSGNSTTCFIDVDVQVAIEIPGSLACVNSINLSLGTDCTAEITPEMLFLGPQGICPNFLCVEVRDPNGDPHPNFFDESDDGQAFRVGIRDCNGTDNACWGTVNIDLKITPQLAWPEDVELLCVEPTDPSYPKNGYPEALNCVRDWTFSYVDNYINYDVCNIPRATIERVWTVFDARGRSQIDTQIINILPYSNEHLLWPDDITIQDPLLCEEVFESLDDIENNVIVDTSTIHPNQTGKPNLFGIPLATNSGVCLFAIGYEDRVLEICPGSYQILREWEVSDVCKSFSEGINPISHTQVITVFDRKEPEVVVAVDTLHLSIDPWKCTYTGPLPYAQIAEACSFATFGAYLSGGGYIETSGSLIDDDLTVEGIDLTIGDHRISNIYKDECGNVTVYNYVAIISDQVVPTPIAVEQLTVSLTAEASSRDSLTGVAKVYTASVDAGSHDNNCSEITTCLILKSELENPILKNGLPVYDTQGRQLYHVDQCHYDGIYYDSTLVDKDLVIAEIPYVICKDYVKFCCENLGLNEVAMIVEDEAGNSSLSWSNILVEDKSIPIITCQDVFVNCDQDISPDSIGYPVNYNSVCGRSNLTYTDLGELSTCGVGTIERQWYTDSIYSCSQFITVLPEEGAFDPTTIKWPVHADGSSVSGIIRECLDSLNDDGDRVYYIVEDFALLDLPEALECAGDIATQPAWCNAPCGLMASSYTDEAVEVTEGCKKIIRHWVVIDWCTYIPNSSDPEVDHNTDVERFELVNDEWLGGGTWLANITPGDSCAVCEHQDNQNDFLYYRYDRVDRDGYYTFDQIIKIIDNEDPKIEVEESVLVDISAGAESKDDTYERCLASATIQAIGLDYCGGLQLDISNAFWDIRIINITTDEIQTLTEVGDTIEITISNIALGEDLRVEWNLDDGCGNTSFASTLVEARDVKHPTPVCIQGLSTTLMNTDGAATIWASDYDLGSYDNCGPVEVAFIDDEGNLVPSLVFTCEDLNAGVSELLELQLYAIDQYGNSDFCIVEIQLSDNADICPDDLSNIASISGELHNNVGEMIEYAGVSLNDGSSMITGETGVYAFDNNPMYAPYTVDPERLDNVSNGVTVADLVQIQKHILGIDFLEDPTQLIAADVNDDDKVTVTDLLEIRKVILAIIQEFPDNSSWRFVDATHEWDDLMAPWDIPESVTIPNLEKNVEQLDFMGIKIGDVTGDAIANSTLKSIVRSPEVLLLKGSSDRVLKGEEFKITVLAENIDIHGLQTTMELSNASFVRIEGNSINISEDQYAEIDKRTITLAWHHDFQSELELDATGTLFTLVLIAEQDLDTDEVLEFSSRITPSLAYDNLLGEFNTISEYINQGEESDELILNQNTPNPFKSSTKIDFYIPGHDEVTFRIFDQLGRLILERTDTYSNGWNHISLKDNQLEGATGIMTYEIGTQYGVRIKKMIVVQ